MSDTGTVLGVDCYELWHAGEVLLPDIAGEFFLASGGVVPGDAHYGFQRAAGIGLGADGAYGAWSSLCDTLDQALNDTGQNLADVGVALRLAAETYAKTDAEAQAEYDKRRKELG